jgi:hypothetical protein
MAFRVIGRKKGAQGLFARDRAINSRAVAAFEKALAKPPKPEHHSVFDTGDRSEVRNFLHDHVDPGVFAPDAVRTLIAAFDWTQTARGRFFSRRACRDAPSGQSTV